MQSRIEVVERLRDRYQRAGSLYRRKLLDELCSVCGYDRKYAIKVLNGTRPGPGKRRRGGSRKVYGKEEAALAAVIWNKSGAQVLARTRMIERELPFPVLGFDSDNGGEFLNHALVRYFRERPKPVYFTRSREYRKNDNAHVEQKNWSKVRQLLGHARYDQPELTEIVHELYRHEWRLLQNFFHPAMKLIKKERRGSRVIKRYDRPETPARRLLAWKELGLDKRAWLEQMQRTLDPIALHEAVNRKIQQIRRILQEGYRYAA